MSFITGQRAARHRYTANHPLPGPVPELPTIMTLLARTGYHTQGVGKMHFHGRHYGFHSLLRMEEGVTFRVDDDYLLTFTNQMEALQRYRGKGKQTIQVQHVQVNGGQAVIGNVKPGGGSDG